VLLRNPTFTQDANYLVAHLYRNLAESLVEGKLDSRQHVMDASVHLMDTDDPITTFFPGEEDVDLYTVLLLGRDAKGEDIKKAYRRLALVYHPDKHASATQDTKDGASRKFQQIGFAYAVLSDEKRRSRYNRTGRTDDGGLDFGPCESGSWETYFEELFDQVTKGKLDELKKVYQSTSKPPLYPFQRASRND